MTETDTMDTADDNTYSVVEFLQKPAPHIDNYVIVPDPWITARKQKIGVLYPEINRSQNIEEFFNFDPKDTPSLNWSVYLSELKYTAKSFEDARDFIKKQSGGFIKKQTFLKEKKTPMKNQLRKKCSPLLENNNCNLLQPSDDSLPQNQNFLYNSGVFMKNMGEILIRESEFRCSDFGYNKLPITLPLPGVNQKGKSKKVVADCCDAPTPRKRVSFSSPLEVTAKSPTPTKKPQELPPGIEKLVQGYDVYIKTEILEDVIRMSYSGIQLVRLLLPYILGRNTLGDYTPIVCKSKPKSTINKHVTDALLKYALICESKNGWSPTSREGLIAGIKSKLSNMIIQAKHK